MTLILSRDELEGLIPMADIIDAVEKAHSDLSLATAQQPAPVSLSLPSSSATFIPMAALADRQGLLALKVMSDIPDNAGRGLPVQRSVILLLSQETGQCLAVIDGQIPTRQRTAAASAVATRYLAREDSRTLGLVGAGKLAIDHVRAMSLVRPIEEVVVWTRSRATAGQFQDALGAFPELKVTFVDSAEAVVRASDILCTLTPSRLPLVHGDWFGPGLHVNAVGAPPRPDHREIDSTGMARSTVFVDSLTTTLQKSGEVLLALAEGAIADDKPLNEIGDVINGLAPGRTSETEITLYDSVGIAMQDLAIGSLILDRAERLGIGTVIDLSPAPRAVLAGKGRP